jgi:hypothetical protein
MSKNVLFALRARREHDESTCPNTSDTYACAYMFRYVAIYESTPVTRSEHVYTASTYACCDDRAMGA